MKDMFEEQLKAGLDKLDTDPATAGMLDQEAIWTRIAKAQQRPEPVWRPGIIKLAAAIIICSLGITLLWQYRQQEVPLAKIPVQVHQKQPAVAKDLQPAGIPVPSSPVAILPVQRLLPANATEDKHKRDNPEHTVAESPAVPVPVKEPDTDLPGRDVVVQTVSGEQPAIIYLSDLEKEEPFVAKTPRKPVNARKVMRYMKSNLEDYAVAPPIVIINQILNK